jgi:hypothetical protein
MERSQAGALESIEYKIAFETRTQGVGEPIAGHVRSLLAICQAGGTQRSSLKPLLGQLDALHRQRHEQLHQVVSAKRMSNCMYCKAPDSLIERDYVSVCQACGYENESCRIQEHAVLLPITNINCGSLKDARKLDAMYKDIGVCVDMVENDLRRMQADGLVNFAQEQRASQLATLYIQHKNLQTRRKCPEIAAACAIYALLETWAAILVPVKVIKKEGWSTKWVLPTVVFTSKKRKHVE